MSSIEQVSTEIKLAETLIFKINDSYQSLQSQFSQQWGTLQISLSKIQSSLQIRIAELDSRELHLISLQNLIDERQKELDLRENKLNSAGTKFVCDRCKTLGFNVGGTGNVVVKIEDEGGIKGNEGEFSGGCGSVRLFVTMDGRTLQMFLNDRVNEHHLIGDEVYCALKLSNDPAKLVLDGMEGFFPPRLKKGGMEYGGSVVRSTCVLLLEQLMKLKPEIKKTVREEARELSRVWRERMRGEMEGCDVVVVGFLVVVVIYGLGADYEKDELRRLCEVVHQHRLVAKIRSRLGLIRLRVNSLPKCSEVSSTPIEAKKEHVDNEKQNDSNVNSYNDNHLHHSPPTLLSPSSMSQKVQMFSASPHFDMGTIGATVKLQTPYITKAVKSPSVNSFVDLHSLCKKMDTNGLKSYLVEHVEELNSLRDKVLDSLQCAFEPALLVFNIVRVFHQESNYTQVGMYLTCCNYLLDLLLKLSPDISTTVKEDTVIFASIWKARLAKQGNKSLHVFGFLKFLAAYRLASSFEADELLSLFSTFYSGDDIYEREENPRLCRALSLEANIPDVIKSLVQENRRLEAVRYICAFKLVDRFPPVPLLEAHIEYTQAAASKRYKSYDFINDPIKAQNKCATRQILALQGVLRCILDFNLEYRVSPIELQQRIRQLEKEKEGRKSLKLEMEKAGNKKRATCFPSEPQVVQEHQQTKHPRLDAEKSCSSDTYVEIC